MKRSNWSASEDQWVVEVEDLITGHTFEDKCHILVHASGYLNKPAWPELPGLDEYDGVRVHSAKYDTNVSLRDKNVLLIGAGSSAAQILPAIQPVVKSVAIFIRSPAWLLPDISTEAGQFTPDEIAKFVSEPDTVHQLRQDNERTMNSIFSENLGWLEPGNIC